MLDVEPVVDWSRSSPGHRVFLIQLALLLGENEALLAVLLREHGHGELVVPTCASFLVVLLLQNLLIVFLRSLRLPRRLLPVAQRRLTRGRPHLPKWQAWDLVRVQGGAWRFDLHRLLDLELGSAQFVIVDFFVHFLAFMVRKLRRLVIVEYSALFLVIARNEIGSDVVGVRIGNERSDASLVARRVGTQIVFEVAHFRDGIGYGLVALSRKVVGLLGRDRGFSNCAIFGGHRFEVDVGRLGLEVARLELTNVTRYRELRTLAMNRRMLVPML